MKNISFIVLLLLSALFGWHEGFDNDGVLESGLLQGDEFAWGWWWWGSEPYTENGSLILQGDHVGTSDPTELNSCWIEVGPHTGEDGILTPSDFDVYIRLKINSNDSPHENNQFYIGLIGNEEFLSTEKAYIAGVGPAYNNRLGVFSLEEFAEDTLAGCEEYCGWTFAEEENQSVIFDEYFWLRAKVENATNFSLWAYLDGEPCPQEPDMEYTQNVVTSNFYEGLILIARQPADTSGGFNDQTIEISDVYYNEVPLGNNYELEITNYELMECFPNPFNPSTTIGFTIPIVETLHATSLQVYNVNGQLIETLVNEQLDAGYHQVVWDAVEFPSGIYFAKFIAEDFTQTQKLLLLK